MHFQEGSKKKPILSSRGKGLHNGACAKPLTILLRAYAQLSLSSREVTCSLEYVVSKGLGGNGYTKNLDFKHTRDSFDSYTGIILEDARDYDSVGITYLQCTSPGFQGNCGIDTISDSGSSPSDSGSSPSDSGSSPTKEYAYVRDSRVSGSSFPMIQVSQNPDQSIQEILLPTRTSFCEQK